MGINKPIRIGRGFTPVYVTVVLTEKAWNRALKGVKGDTGTYPANMSASCTDFMATKDGAPSFVLITISKVQLKRGHTLAALVAHEAIHAKQFCERVMGTTFDIETEAYYVQHVTQEIMRKIKRYRG